MDFQAFAKYMLCEDDMSYYGVGENRLGYEMKLTFPTYRGTFLCNVTDLSVYVDGRLAPNKDYRICVNGNWYTMDETDTAYKEYWFTGDKAVLRILDEEPPAPGEHEVRVVMTYKVPYTGYFGSYMVNTRECTKKLQLVSESVTDETGGGKHDPGDFCCEELKIGACIYSYAKLFFEKEYDVAALVKEAKENGFTGITIVAAQFAENYPHIKDEWLYALKAAMEKYGMDAVSWEAYIDMGMRNDRDLTEEEILEFTRNDIVYAKKAGFRMVKTQQSISPQLFAKMLPFCKKMGVKLCIEIHFPHNIHLLLWQEYLKIMAESDGYLGIAPDMSIFQNYPHKLHIDQAFNDPQCRKEKIQQILREWDVKKGVEVLETMDLNEREKMYGKEFYEKNGVPSDPEDLKLMLPYSHMLHGKFYYLGEDETDPCIPYEEIMKIVKDYGYKGYITAEYEGHHFSTEEDERVQMTRYQSMLRRLL